MLHKVVWLALVLIGAGTAAPIAPQAFSFTGVNRFVTPNGDRKNDTAVFRYDNAQDAAGTIRVYEVRGHLVSTIAIEPGTTSAAWDPRGYANGIYIFVITINQESKSGVLVVVR